MDIEAFLSAINANVFLREFSFDRTQFSPTPGTELELADHVLLLGRTIVLFQVKERQVTAASPASEAKWFENKVIRRATRQVRDTLKYLNESETVTVTNQRGHSFNLADRQSDEVIKLVVYKPAPELPSEFLNRRFHESRSAGFIHLFSITDYTNVCRVLVTPADIIDYLRFREDLLGGSEGTDLLLEQAIVGQFIAEDWEVEPSNKFASVLTQLDDDNFSLNSLFQDFSDRIAYGDGTQDETDYYHILQEYAKLTRPFLREAKKRMRLCMEACDKNEFRRPYRFLVPTTQCGFVFVPLQEDVFEHRITGLQNLTYAAKYESRLDRYVGASFVKQGDIYFVDWCFMSFPWETDERIERQLRENYPFRDLRVDALEHFNLRGSE